MMADGPTELAKNPASVPIHVPERLLRRINLYSGRLATDAVKSMKLDLPLFRDLSANQISEVQLTLQGAVQNFVRWVRRPDDPEVRSIPLPDWSNDLSKTLSFTNTVEIIRAAMEFFEQVLPRATREGPQRTALLEAILRFGREIGFAVASQYANAAESRGAWDTRMEAMVVDAVVRGVPDPDLPSRAAALNWRTGSSACVVVGEPHPEWELDSVTMVHKVARQYRRSALAVIQGSFLVTIISAEESGWDEFLQALLEVFSDGPVVIGTIVPDLMSAHISAREALSGMRATVGWPDAPRPVPAADLLLERLLNGDALAATELIDSIITPLQRAGGELSETLSAYFRAGGHVEACARELFVHPNTVRYRLKRVLHITKLDPLDARDSYILRVADSVGRLRNTSLNG